MYPKERERERRKSHARDAHDMFGKYQESCVKENKSRAGNQMVSFLAAPQRKEQQPFFSLFTHTATHVDQQQRQN